MGQRTLSARDTANVKEMRRLPAGSPFLTFTKITQSSSVVLHAFARERPQRVGVVGQGLIGLLVTAILAGRGFDVTAFEITKSRQALAARLGAGTVLDPRTAEFGDDLDVAVEVTGAEAGLQTAIDRVGDGGRVVIGSLFGNR